MFLMVFGSLNSLTNLFKKKVVVDIMSLHIPDLSGNVQHFIENNQWEKREREEYTI